MAGSKKLNVSSTALTDIILRKKNIIMLDKREFWNYNCSGAFKSKRKKKGDK